MKRRSLSPSFCLLLVLCAFSCAMDRPEEPLSAAGLVAQAEPTAAPALEPAEETPPAEPEPARPPSLRDTPAAAPSAGPAAESQPVLPFASPGPAITETLEKTLDLLAESRAENQRLKETVLNLQSQLRQREDTLEELRQDLAECDEKIKKTEDDLAKWRDDVLGFRDEMREAEEAELEVLQEILTLLKNFKKEKAVEE
ncbi:MAG: hypothetical protein PVJ27_09290 [Candidatus Brocadiaceae bacterium]